MKQSIIIAGDLLPWSNNIRKFEQGESADLYSQDICELFANADFSIVNLEGPLTNATKKQHKIGPAIKGSIESVNALKQLGVKCVALANNHITDFLNQGFEDTINVLKQSGINHVGAGKQGEIKTHISLELDEKKVCIYNVSETFFNQPTKDIFGANLYDEYIVCNEIKELKNTHDYLIVIYHGGAEYFQYPSPQTRKRFYRMADCGADFITAQHTHCIGCEEHYNGSYLLHGQGNFSFAKQANEKLICRQGIVCELIFEDGDVTIRNHCVEMQGNGCLVYKADEFLAGLKERSNNINNRELIEENFRKLKPYNIVDRYLSADKGNLSFELKIKKRFFPKAYRKSMLNSYSRSDIERQYFVLSSDRAREDVYFVMDVPKLSDNVPNEIPCWERVKAAALTLHGRLPQLDIVGWDFSVTPDGMPVLIEFNPRPGVGLQQAVGPMFSKEDLDELMEHVSKVKSEYVPLGLIQFADRPDRKTVHLKFGGR